MNRTDSNTSLVNQALAWLDRMCIPYNDISLTDFWSFEYKGVTMHIPKDCGYTEIGFYAPAIITTDDDDEDESTFKHIFDFAAEFAKDAFAEVSVEYCSGGLCLVSQWWECKGRNKLYKYRFVEMIESVCKLQSDVQFALEAAELALFNPPKEVVEEIFKDINTIEVND